MNTNHVRSHKSVPVDSVPSVTGLLPVACAHCGARVHIGLPIRLNNLGALVEAFTNAHAECPPRGAEDADE